MYWCRLNNNDRCRWRWRRAGVGMCHRNRCYDDPLVIHMMWARAVVYDRHVVNSRAMMNNVGYRASVTAIVVPCGCVVMTLIATWVI